MCWERKVRYWTCGHYGDSTWEQCALYPDCGHTIWGIPYEEGGLGPQDDVVVNEKCPRHGKKKKEHWPDGMSFLPDDDRPDKYRHGSYHHRKHGGSSGGGSSSKTAV